MATVLFLIICNNICYERLLIPKLVVSFLHGVLVLRVGEVEENRRKPLPSLNETWQAYTVVIIQTWLFSFTRKKESVVHIIITC